jgi:hypothetical protein
VIGRSAGEGSIGPRAGKRVADQRGWDAASQMRGAAALQDLVAAALPERYRAIVTAAAGRPETAQLLFTTREQTALPAPTSTGTCGRPR